MDVRHMEFHSSAAASLAAGVSNGSLIPAAFSASYANNCLKGTLNPWHFIWIYPLNVITSTISLGLQIVAMAVNLIAAFVLTLQGFATQDLSKRAWCLEDADAMLRMTGAIGLDFCVTFVNLIFPAADLHEIQYEIVARKPIIGE